MKHIFKTTVAFFSIFLCSNLLAISYDVNVNGSSGTLTVTVTPEGGEKQTIDIAIWCKAQPIEKVNPEPVYEPHDDGTMTVTSFSWEPNPSYTKENYCALGNWLPPLISFSWIDAQGEVQSKTIPLATLKKLVGARLSMQLELNWKEAELKSWQQQVPYECNPNNSKKTYGHYYPLLTCKCKFCGNDRGHKFNTDFIGNNCKKCVNWTGWELKHSNTYCGGYSLNEQDHIGFHHEPKTPYIEAPDEGDPPGFIGYASSCVCQCGNFKYDHNNSQDNGYSKGDLTGENRQLYHTHVFLCQRCQMNPYGWCAVVEGHDVPNGEIHTYYYVNESEGIVGKDCAVDDPQINKSCHIIVGRCTKCHDDIYGETSHVWTSNPCVCDTCHAITHNFQAATCEGCATCMVCGKSFPRYGGVVDYTTPLTEEQIPSHHSYSEDSKFKDGGDWNYEVHRCLCWKQVLHAHNWEDSGVGQKTCVDGDDGTKGCGLNRHNQSNCDHKLIHGSCGQWSCRVCGKALTTDSRGNTLPQAHASYSEYLDTGIKYWYSGYIGKDYHCAMCNHKAGGVRCGTLYDKDGPHYTPTTLNSDWRMHTPFSTAGLDEHLKPLYHRCKCGAFPAREHNLGTCYCSIITEGLGIYDTKLHSINFVCDKTSGGVRLLDTCGERFTRKEAHAYRDYETGGHKVYRTSPDNTEVCQKKRECHRLDGNGVYCGCGLIDWLDGSHDMNYRANSCIPIDDFKHCYFSDCSHYGCDHSRAITNGHNYVEYTDDNASYHHHWKKCEGDVSCGNITNTLPKEFHSENKINKNIYTYDSRYNHSISQVCSTCSQIFGVGTARHDRFGSESSDIIVGWNGRTYHEGSNVCGKCDHAYLNKQDFCNYDWSGADWYLAGDIQEDDSAECSICHTRGLLSHKWAYQNDTYHFCSNGGGHFRTVYPHTKKFYEGAPEEYWYCEVCGYKNPPPQAGEHCDCDCCYDVNNCKVGFINGRCGCYPCQAGNEDECVCAQLTRSLKFNSPMIDDYKYVAMYNGTNVDLVDMADPVYSVGVDSFRNAFENGQIIYVNCSQVTNVSNGSFREAFKNCKRLNFVNFSRLKKITENSFAGAFYGCTNLTQVSFESVTNIDEYAFKVEAAGGIGAFEKCYNLRSLKFPNLEEIAVDLGWADVFGVFYADGEKATAPNFMIGSFEMPKLKYFLQEDFNPSGFFKSSVLTNVDLRSVTSVSTIEMSREGVPITSPFEWLFDSGASLKTLHLEKMTLCGVGSSKEPCTKCLAEYLPVIEDIYINDPRNLDESFLSDGTHLLPSNCKIHVNYMPPSGWIHCISNVVYEGASITNVTEYWEVQQGSQSGNDVTGLCEFKIKYPYGDITNSLFYTYASVTPWDIREPTKLENVSNDIWKVWVPFDKSNIGGWCQIVINNQTGDVWARVPIRDSQGQ